MKSPLPHVTVCVCTFRRPDFLKRLLGDLEWQRTENRFTYSIVISDNDAAQSAKTLVHAFGVKSRIKIVYCAEAEQNIALARNKALENATGDFIAFIDDDEFPAADWLLRMVETCEKYQVAGVLGPVRPHFEETPPRWIIHGGFCERPEYPTGTIIPWNESRTGNLLFRRRILEGIAQPFRPQFGTGGEDVDFFLRMTRRGCVFRWCNEAAAYQTVPAARWKRSYMLKRALLRGQNNLKLRGNRLRLLATSAVAVPVYSVVLLPTLVLGQHRFMKYSIKLCDHLGRLLAFMGISPIRERQT